MNVITEISIFAPNSRKTEATIVHLIPGRTIDVLRERLGNKAAAKARKALAAMNENELDLIQFRHDDRRIRIKQSA